MAVTPEQVRKARTFLRARALTPPLSARSFAASAVETGKTFAELLRFIMRLKQGGQNQSAQRQEIIRSAAGADQ